MAEENKNTVSFTTKDELTKFLLDLQGQIVSMQETIDKLAPAKEEPSDEGKANDEEVTDEEISEIDRLLQDN